VKVSLLVTVVFAGTGEKCTVLWPATVCTLVVPAVTLTVAVTPGRADPLLLRTAWYVAYTPVVVATWLPTST
jgi:hypothetical protein